jgi:hypothetical protein
MRIACALAKEARGDKLNMNAKHQTIITLSPSSVSFLSDRVVHHPGNHSGGDGASKFEIDYFKRN